MPDILTAGEIGRLTALSGNAATDDKIPIYDTSLKQLRFATPDQIASGASAVDGPASATDNAIARFDGTTGKLIQNSAVTVADTTGALSIAGTSNQFVLGTTNTTTISATAPSASRVYTMPDVGGAADFVMTLGGQTIQGVKIFGDLIRFSNGQTITAYAGGGQGSATAITTTLANITTCATAGDSVALPAGTSGYAVAVYNGGVATAAVFPASGGTISPLSANTAVTLPAGEMLIFECSATNTWRVQRLKRPASSFSTGTTTTTFAAGQLTGAGAVVTYTNTQGTPGSIATRTATEMFADDPYARVGGTYILRIVNGQGTGTLTVTAGSNVTLTGTATVAINTWREWQVSYTSATALVMQNIGTGTFN
jgi:hypothetical protein